MGASFVSADEAAAMIEDGDTVALMGGGGGLMEATCLFQAIERRFLRSARPRGLGLVHALGIGDRQARGVNCFAHEGLVRKVIGGHWVWSPRMQALARDEKIAAYILPGGVSSQLLREIGAGRPGLITHVGLGTVCDPRHGGGRMNASAREELAELIKLDGREYLRYKPYQVDVALVRGSVADEDGNIGFEHEAADLDACAIAQAARACRGRVIVQVRERVPRGALGARQVRIPGAWVDAIVVDAQQRTSYDIDFDPELSGELTGRARQEAARRDARGPGRAFSERDAIARRAACELFDGAVVNYGVGIPDAVAGLVARRGELHRIHQTIEHGIYGGSLLDGSLFGYARNPSAILDAPTQFDFYGGGGLDIAMLGFGEFDAAGNVNVSRLGGLTVGPGGFIDIAQNARKVVFCGSFEAKGVELRTGDGSLRITRHGQVRKLVREVEQISFSGEQALRRGQQVLYLTERASFRLGPQGVELFEVAPGVDLRRDVLERMGFLPRLGWAPAPMPALMPASHFRAVDDGHGSLSSRDASSPAS